MSASEPSSETPKVGATRARQGRWGFHVFLVLLIGTVLAALALFGAWAWRSGELAATDRGQPRAPGGEAAEVFSAPDPRAIQTPPATTQPTTQAAENRAMGGVQPPPLQQQPVAE